ncbi:MAG TPA: hypothetical protein VGM36_09635, partial [Rhizomicrobium sp.]
MISTIGITITMPMKSEIQRANRPRAFRGRAFDAIRASIARAPQGTIRILLYIENRNFWRHTKTHRQDAGTDTGADIE